MAHGNFTQFLAQSHNKLVNTTSIKPNDVFQLTYRATAIASISTHYAFLAELPLSYQPLTPVFFENNHINRVLQDDLPNHLRPRAQGIDNPYALNLHMLDQIDGYLKKHKEVQHLAPYIHWAKAVNLVYQYQFKEALTEYELCLDGLLYRKHPANTALPSDPISLNLVPT